MEDLLLATILTWHRMLLLHRFLSFVTMGFWQWALLWKKPSIQHSTQQKHVKYRFVYQITLNEALTRCQLILVAPLGIISACIHV